MEHLQHFGLAEDPFRNEPRLREFFETRGTREALARLDRGLRQAKGLLVLVGELGAGKTMVVRRLLDQLEEEVFEASMLVVLNAGADATWMLTRFAKQLGVEEPEPEREALLAQVYERLAIIREDGRHAVLIIDDAHALASRATLAEICGLLKLEYEDRRLFSLVLAGEPALEQALDADPALAHRVEVKVRLGPLDADGAAAYLAHRVRLAGGDPAVLDPGALAALHKLGRGLPGLMNTLADNGLFEAFLCGRRRVTAADVQRAHRDLGWEGPAAGRAAAPERDREPDALGELDAELEAVFEAGPFEDPPPARPARAVRAAPPPREDEDDDLVIELLD